MALQARRVKSRGTGLDDRRRERSKFILDCNFELYFGSKGQGRRSVERHKQRRCGATEDLSFHKFSKKRSHYSPLVAETFWPTYFKQLMIHLSFIFKVHSHCILRFELHVQATNSHYRGAASSFYDGIRENCENYNKTAPTSVERSTKKTKKNNCATKSLNNRFSLN